MKFDRKWLALGAIVLLIGLPVASRMLKGPDAKEVDVEKADLRMLMPSILASGTLVYESQVTLMPEVIGRVTDLYVKEGDTVQKGQMLMRLDAEETRSQILQLEAGRKQSELNIERQRVNLESLITKTKRYEMLREHGMVEATKYDEFNTQKDLAGVELRTSREAAKQADAQLRQSELRLSKTEIRAPISGKVTSISIKVGETAVPSAVSIAGSNLMVIGDTRSLFAEINVDEADIAKVVEGQSAKIVPAAFPDKALDGRVEQIAMAPRQSTGQSKTYPVRIRLQLRNDMRSFHPGMSCRAEIATVAARSTQRLAVPIQAVQYEETDAKSDKLKSHVFVLRDGKVLRRDVETGVADDTHIEVISGLARNESIVTGPAKSLRFLRDGEPARAKSAEALRGTEPAGRGKASAP